jgi:DNA (cytosine-5)-methyltransferase 1
MFTEIDPFCCWLLRSRDHASHPAASYSKQVNNSDAGNGLPNWLRSQMVVRRLTPKEHERLQGFPDAYTLIEYRGKVAFNGPRYKILGNSMAVPVMRWIGQRIAEVDAILREHDARREP